MSPGIDSCNSQIFAPVVSLLLAGCSPGLGQAGWQGSGSLLPRGLHNRAGAPLAFGTCVRICLRG